jgi:hypothetical protein
METYGEMDVYLYAFLISELDEGECLVSRQDRFTYEENVKLSLCLTN